MTSPIRYRSFQCASLQYCAIAAAIAVALGALPVRAAESRRPVGSVAALVKLLESGRLPAERRGAVVELICSRGNADDLAFVLDTTVGDDFDVATRLNILELLTDAAVTRKVKPAGDLNSVVRLLAPSIDPKLRRAAVRLAAVWKIPTAAEPLRSIAGDARADEALRVAAIDGLALSTDKAGREALARLVADDASAEVRFRSAAALVKLDPTGSVEIAANTLARATADDDVGPLIDAFLTRKGGADRLAKALATAKPTTDAAKVALRYVYSVGRSDAELSRVLGEAAGIAGDPKKPTPAELKQILAEVAEQGDAARGERIFRRADLSCMKCHALGRAGGQIGPDLSAVGSISPPDYVANSILDPNLAIKEQFVTRIITTADGESFTGIVVDRDDVRVNLRDAAGKIVTIPKADIEDEEEGKSLMPQGLTKFLTRAELVDLVRFISELGRPGAYALRTTPTIQRWRVLKADKPELAEAATNVETFRQSVLGASADAWKPAYGTARGTLPTAEFGSAGDRIYLQGEVTAVEAGEVQVTVTSDTPAAFWFDAEPFPPGGSPPMVRLSKGRHKITVLVTVPAEGDGSLKVELVKPAGSKAQFDVVGGS
jgi:putative heme-binding domain-containing protein